MSLQLLKHQQLKRTKNIIDLGNHAKYRRIMTGSPVTKNPLDLYTQCYFLDPFHLDHLLIIHLEIDMQL